MERMLQRKQGRHDNRKNKILEEINDSMEMDE
jgi:hypothetical protein